MAQNRLCSHKSVAARSQMLTLKVNSSQKLGLCALKAFDWAIFSYNGLLDSKVYEVPYV